jgi:hypothetical protein
MHQGLCGSLASLRRAPAIDSQFGIEAIARINAAVADRTLLYVSRCGLDPSEALLNALRPWERLCTFAEAGPIPLCGGVSADEVSSVLQASTHSQLAALLTTAMPSSEALAIASVLCSAPHTRGLTERLVLNSFQWDHPTERALRFGGVFMMASNCNHSCAPNAEIGTRWVRTAEAAEAADGEEAVAEEVSVSEVCSFTLRTTADVAAGDELTLAYVDRGLPVEERRLRLRQWGFWCTCTRCEAEAPGEGPPWEVVVPQAAAAGGGAADGGRGDRDEAAGEAGSHKRQRTSAARVGTTLPTRDRPEVGPKTAEIARRVRACAELRVGDWRYSVVPDVVPRETILRLSREFFETTELLTKAGNTFGADFETMYQGHRNYFYHVNKNAVVPGSDGTARLFDELDAYTRGVVDLHHPGVRVRLDRAFGAYYEGERENFHLGVSEHCDGDTHLVSTVVHAVMPDGDAGFTEGGELTISATSDLPAQPIAHSNASIGTVVYMGGSVRHLASPIKLGSRRLVFCMFYACEDGVDLAKHVL